MRRLIFSFIFLAFSTCICIVGGLFCYPALPHTAEALSALASQYAVQETPAPAEQTSHPPQTLSPAQVLQAFGTDADLAADTGAIVYFSGSVTAGGQSYHYGAYVVRPHTASLPQVLRTEGRSELTDPSWTNVILNAVAEPANGGIQLIGNGLFEQAQPVSLLVRDGWSLKSIHTTWYARYPYSYQMTCHI